MPEQPTPTPVAAPPEEVQRADPLASAVAEAVGKLRRTAGLSERAAARRLGTSQTQLRRMEDPRYLPSLRSLARLATVYGYDLRVDFTQKGAVVQKPAPAPKPVSGGQRSAPAQKAPPKKKPAPRKRASGSASPSKGRAGAPRRGRAAARARVRRAAPRRRS